MTLERLEPVDGTIHLAEFEEASGRLLAIERDEAEVRVELSIGTLRYPQNSAEAVVCLEELGEHVGSRVAIMRTPSSARPLVTQVTAPSG